MRTIRLTEKVSIGQNHPCFVIAEAGVNHNGDLVRALEMVDVAADAGADAVKFQTFKTENIITRTAPKAQYHIETTGADHHQSWFDLLKSQELDEAMHIALMKRCAEKGILFLSTPYDRDSVDLLHRLGVVAFKIASTDANNISLLEYIADKALPMMLSTAMATMDELEQSEAAIRARGLQDLIVLQCTGNYPSSDADANLKAIQTLGEKFDLPTGYSDHVPGKYAAVAAIALGAMVYEKHFTLDRNLPGPDHRASAEPAELKEIISAIRSTERMMGDGVKRVMPCEEQNRIVLRKSIVAARAISAGSRFGADEIRVVRAGGRGLSADRYYSVLGKLSKVDLAINDPITIEMLSE
jgi:N-acetylneuraminate synthase/N,N'-diacetyllegionaminate synthase